MKLNFLFLTKLLVSVFLVCGVMFFAGCGDDDDEKQVKSREFMKANTMTLTVNLEL
ncbi:MAG: hypothetical protein FWF51_09435 [Chitinivibrionia bacterium]|nr:hypothetical protein [Chitinivibrionia bacterium]